MQTDYDDEVCFRAVQKIRDLSLRQDDAAVLPHRLVHEPARSVGDPAALLGSLRRARDRPARRRRRCRASEADAHSLRLRDMIGLDERPLERGRGAARAARLLRGDQLPRRARRRGARRALGDRARSRHGRRLHGRPRRAAGRARALVQDVVPRGIRARAAHRPRPGRARPGASRGRSRSSTSPPRSPSWRARRPTTPASRAAASRARCAGAPAPGEAFGEYLAEGVQRARRDDPPRTPQVRPLSGRSGPALRPRGRPARAAQPRGRAPRGEQLAAAFRAESDERWDLAGLERGVLESQRSRRLVARALACGAYDPWDFQPYSDASLLYVRSEAARGPRPGRSRPAGGLPPSSQAVT